MHSYNVLEKMIRMFRVMGRNRPEIRNGLEVAASLAELYQEVVEPSGRLAEERLDMERIDALADNIRQPHEVPFYRARDPRTSSDIAPQDEQSRAATIAREGLARKPQYDFGGKQVRKHKAIPAPLDEVVFEPHRFEYEGKSSEIAKRIMLLRRAGLEMFEKRLVILRAGEGKFDLTNALTKLQGLHYIDRAEVPGVYKFKVEVPPDAAPEHQSGCALREQRGLCTCGASTLMRAMDDVSALYAAPL